MPLKSDKDSYHSTIDKIHSIELRMSRKIGELKTEVSVLEEKVVDLVGPIKSLHRAFYSTFILVLLTYMVEKLIL